MTCQDVYLDMSLIYPDILFDIYSGILFGSLPDIYFDIYSAILSGILSDIYSDILSDIYSDIYSDILSGREHWAWMVVVEVRQGTLGVDGRG